MKSIGIALAALLLLAACATDDPSSGQLRSGPEVSSVENLAALFGTTNTLSTAAID
jgi:hypothetical protein